LPTDQYAVFGSGPLAIRNLRSNEDIDIIVTDELWQTLMDKYKPNKKGFLEVGVIEILNHWEPYFDKSEPLIKNADFIEGIPFVKLEHIKSWKERMGREKDLNDVKLIDDYLKQQKTI